MSWVGWVKSQGRQLVEKVTPIQDKSTYMINGQISPEEFYAAGQALVAAYPIWRWEVGNSKSEVALAEDSLEPPKRGPQFHEYFLVCSEVIPRPAPAAPVLNFDRDDLPAQDGADVKASALSEDLDDLHLTNADDDDDDDGAAVRVESKLDGVPVYTIYITYSRSYRVPRMFLSATLNGSPMSPHDILENVHPDYSDETATVDTFPFYLDGPKKVMIHPCKHAHVMKIHLLRAEAEAVRRREEAERLAGRGGKDEFDVVDTDEVQPAVPVERYLFHFLKMASAMFPLLDIDITVPV